MTLYEFGVWAVAVVCAVGWWDAARGWRRANALADRALEGWDRERHARLRDLDACAEKLRQLTRGDK